MKITLQRLYQGDDCTLGVLASEDELLCYTLENPWKDNTPNISCIPEGKYNCEPHNGVKYKDTWQITSVPGRSFILFHAGNTESDTRGCILPGTVIGSLGGERAVLGSRIALNKFKKLVGTDNAFKLIIKGV